MEVYVEQLVKREITQSENRMKTILGVICVVFAVLTFLTLSLIFLVPFLVVGIYTYLYNGKLGCLMEYVFNGDELVVTRMTTSRRKKIYTCKMERVISFCHHSEYRAPGQETKNVKDYSAGVLGKDTYVMIVNGEKGKEKVFFDPEEDMLQAMRRVAPSVVKVLPKYGR